VRMRTVENKVVPKRYTGFILVGQCSYGYVPPIKIEVEIDKLKDGIYTVMNDSHRKLSLLFTSVLKFVKHDFNDYEYKFWHIPYWDANYRYFVTLEFYIRGKLMLQFKFVMKVRTNIYIPNIVTLITAMIYMLSRTLNEQDIRFEYVKQYAYNPYERTQIYNSTIGEYIVSHYDNYSSICISYQAAIGSKERAYLCTHGRIAEKGQDFYFSESLYRGYGVHTRTAIYVCLQDIDGLKAVVLGGNDDALDKDYRLIFGLSLDDLDKVGDILCNSE